MIASGLKTCLKTNPATFFYLVGNNIEKTVAFVDWVCPK